MTGLVRKATFFVACAMLLGAAASFAGIVSPGNCTVGATRINLVGYNSSGTGDLADSLEIFSKLTVTVRDIANNPIAGVPVVLDFSACASGDIKIGNFQSFHGQTVGCATATVQNYSTSNGTVSFVVVGGRSSSTDHALGCAKVYADSYLLGSLNVGTFDQTNSSGFTLADIAFFWTDVNSGIFHDRTDMDGSGSLVLADIAYAWTANGHASSFNASSAVLCP
jgi:hypothetical protein